MPSWKIPMSYFCRVRLSQSLVDVAMYDLRGILFLLQVTADNFGQRYRSMPAASAPQRNRQIAFSFAYVQRDQIREQTFDPPQKFTSLRKRADVPRHLRIFAAEGP